MSELSVAANNTGITPAIVMAVLAKVLKGDFTPAGIDAELERRGSEILARLAAGSTYLHAEGWHRWICALADEYGQADEIGTIALRAVIDSVLNGSVKLNTPGALESARELVRGIAEIDDLESANLIAMAHIAHAAVGMASVRDLNEHHQSIDSATRVPISSLDGIAERCAADAARELAAYDKEKGTNEAEMFIGLLHELRVALPRSAEQAEQGEARAKPDLRAQAQAVLEAGQHHYHEVLGLIASEIEVCGKIRDDAERELVEWYSAVWGDCLVSGLSCEAAKLMLMGLDVEGTKNAYPRQNDQGWASMAMHDDVLIPALRILAGADERRTMANAVDGYLRGLGEQKDMTDGLFTPAEAEEAAARFVAKLKELAAGGGESAKLGISGPPYRIQVPAEVPAGIFQGRT